MRLLRLSNNLLGLLRPLRANLEPLCGDGQQPGKHDRSGRGALYSGWTLRDEKTGTAYAQCTNDGMAGISGRVF
jgi:hypothetical protein